MIENQQRHFIIIDGYGFVFRAYHSMPPLTSPDGSIVGAVYGFTSMLFKLFNDIKATHIVVVFDTGKKNFRSDIYPAYKANRPPVPEDLRPQFAMVREAAEALNLKVLELDGYEADDIIATLVNMSLKDNEPVTIVSSDKDLMQLVCKSVRMFDAMKSKFITSADVIDKFGVPPSQVLDLLSLMGDSSDNIPGIPGVGPKTAVELLHEFGSLEGLLENFHLIKQDRRKNLIEQHQESARLSKKLVSLVYDVPIDATLEDLKIRPVDANKCFSFIHKYGFKSLINKAEAYLATKMPTSPVAVIKQDVNYEIITDLNILKKWLSNVEVSGKLALYPQSEHNHIIGIGLAYANDCACYVPIAHNNPQANLLDKKTSLTLIELMHHLKPIMQDESVLKISYNLKKIRAENLHFNKADDVLLLSYLVNNGLESHDLNNLVLKYFNVEIPNLDDLCGSGRNKLKYSQLEVSKIGNIIASKANYLFKLHIELKQQIFTNKMLDLYQNVDLPLSDILFDIERTGVKLDITTLKAISEEFAERLVNLEREIFLEAKQEFNIGSPKQMADVLFKSMGLQAGKTSKTGNLSTNVDILEQLQDQGHKIASLILEWRHLSKLKSTYSDALQLQATDEGRVHTTFTMALTSTGRLSSTEPNLQNIPVRSEEGTKIRRAFIATEGYNMISADYSQVELRLLAHMANITSLKEAFNQQKDIHAATASGIFGVALEQVDSNMRRKAKAINFGIIYGVSSFGLAKQLDISKQDASNYIKAYFKEYPGIELYMSETKNYVRQHGYVKTLHGRRCHFKAINDKNAIVRSLTERAAINAPIQGTAADIIKIAMIKLNKSFAQNKLDIKVVLQIHDELLFEVNPKDQDLAMKIIKSIMENVISISVPLVVDIKAGSNWAEIH